MSFWPVRRTLGMGALAALLLALVSTTTQAQVAKQGAAASKSRSLVRYVPGDGLVVLLDHEGVGSQPAAWKGTAAYKMLNETALGAMLEDIAVQVADRGLQAVPGAPINGKDAVALLSHLGSKGFAFGFCGSFSPPRPQPKAGVFVVRDAAKNEVFTRVVKRLEAFAKQVDAPGERKVWVSEGAPLRWWFENDDLVISFAPPGAPDPVIATLDGSSPSAMKNAGVIALAKAEPGVVPLGLLMVDLAGMPPFPPDAVRLGLDGVKRLESCWGIREKAVLISFGVHAPRPRRGVLALFDQPPLGAGTRFADPKKATDHTLLSVDPLKLGDVLVTILKQSDPRAAEEFDRVAQDLQRRTGVKLGQDILGKIGPRMGVLAPGAGWSANIIAMWFSPPNIGIVAELKDPKGFTTALDRLVEAANVELKKAGALVPPPPGQDARPGTAFAEFRRLKAPEQGYVLAVPPSVLPTPAGLRPTILIDAKRGRIALAGSPAAARRVLPALILDAPKSRSTEDRDALLIAQSDPSGGLPELLVNLPSLVQMVGVAAAQPPRPGATPRPRLRPNAAPFRLELDPDSIPDVEAIRAHLFPSRFALTANESSIRLTSSTAFPLPVPQFNAGMETPFLIALLMPAVQAAREAARRSQCVNNLKQMGLAMHNYHSINDRFPPPAILSKQGQPLLSWRVALLPYLEQEALYNEFHLDEPWDSEHNKALIDRMPAVFRCPSASAPEPGTTAYRVFTGKGAAFDQPEGLPITAVVDGTSNTIGIVEAKEAVAWTKPEDLPFTGDGAAAFELLGSDHAGGFNALFLDGSVRLIKKSIIASTLKALLTYSGGEVVGGDSY